MSKNKNLVRRLKRIGFRYYPIDLSCMNQLMAHINKMAELRNECFSWLGIGEERMGFDPQKRGSGYCYGVEMYNPAPNGWLGLNDEDGKFKLYPR